MEVLKHVLVAKHFYSPAHQDWWRCALKVLSDGRELDEALIHEEWKRTVPANRYPDETYYEVRHLAYTIVGLHSQRELARRILEAALARVQVEIAHKHFQSALNKRDRRSASEKMDAMHRELDAARTDFAARLAQLRGEVPPDAEEWTPSATEITFDALMRKDLASVRWCVEGVLPEGFSLLMAKMKDGKSWLAYALALAKGLGGRAFGQIAVEQCDVLYLALEDNQRRLKKRGALIASDLPSVPGLTIDTRWPRMGEGGLERLREYLNKHPNCRLIIIDVVGKITPRQRGRGNGYAEDYSELVPLQELAGEYPGLTVLGITHTTKTKHDDWMHNVNATTGAVAVADNVLYLDRPRGEADGILHAEGPDIEEDPDLALRFDSTTHQWVIVGKGAEVQRTKEQKQVIEAITDGGGLASIKQAADATGLEYRIVKARMFHYLKVGILSAVNGMYAVASNPSTSSTSSNPSTASNPSERSKPGTPGAWVRRLEGLEGGSNQGSNLDEPAPVQAPEAQSDPKVRRVRTFEYIERDGVPPDASPPAFTPPSTDPPLVRRVRDLMAAGLPKDEAERRAIQELVQPDDSGKGVR